ncbi:hypothetical protein [Absidia glauca]|uniref:CUE domain-containing protein n=1 Tax=Absidia glauca TaxID=4829 RepID=A0A163J3Q0_ABSGL|nr:hypothetical protein [Absidia glauca]
MIEMVRAMFPDVPTAAIQADLQRTGSVETTVDNALRDGGLPMPATPTTSQPGSPSLNNTSSSSSRKPTNYSSLLQRYKLDTDRLAQDELTEPPKVWEQDAAKRQDTLKKRKEFMVLQARRKLMEQQQKQKDQQQQQPVEQTTTTAPSLIPEQQDLVSSDTSKSAIGENFDELSVDELNTLSPEQRRRHMLQAFEKKNAI